MSSWDRGMTMTEAQYRHFVFEAAKGLNALNAFIETRFHLADAYEAEGDLECAEIMRDTWSEVWATLVDVPQRALAAELHDIMSPPVPDELLVGP